jgi:hypothetical protein
MFLFYCIGMVGNTNLQKWSFSTLRRAGLCEDHFTPDSFNPKSVNKGLKRNAVPIPFDLSVAQKNSKEIDRKRKNSNEEARRENIVQENIVGQSRSVIEKKAMTFTLASDNVIIDEQPLQKPPLKIYKPAHSDEKIVEELMPISENTIIHEQSFQELPLKSYKPVPHLYFNIPEEEDNMNWINIESRECEVSMANLHNDDTNKKNEQSKENYLIKKLNDAEKEINYLKSKNNRL